MVAAKTVVTEYIYQRCNKDGGQSVATQKNPSASQMFFFLCYTLRLTVSLMLTTPHNKFSGSKTAYVSTLWVM